MRREPLVYGGLLVAGLFVALLTWIQQNRAEPGAGSVAIWREKADAIVSVDYASPDYHLELQRRGPEGAAYLWATQDTSSFRLAEGVTHRLLDALARPEASRDLGVPDSLSRRAFGLDTTETRIVVRFRDGTRSLSLGAPTIGRQGDRYVLDDRSGHAFVLPSGTLPQLDDAVHMLVERRLQAFSADSVETVTLRAGGRTRVMHRLVPARAAALPTARRGEWAPAIGPQRPDSAFAVFLSNVLGAAAESYAPRENPATMESVFRMAFAGRGGKALGSFELLRRSPAGATPAYFARTELTGVPVRLYHGMPESLLAALARLP